VLSPLSLALLWILVWVLYLQDACCRWDTHDNSQGTGNERTAQSIAQVGDMFNPAEAALAPRGTLSLHGYP
jgi:hypothetical protein